MFCPLDPMNFLLKKPSFQQSLQGRHSIPSQNICGAYHRMLLICGNIILHFEDILIVDFIASLSPEFNLVFRKSIFLISWKVEEPLKNLFQDWWTTFRKLSWSSHFASKLKGGPLLSLNWDSMDKSISPWLDPRVGRFST